MIIENVATKTNVDPLAVIGEVLDYFKVVQVERTKRELIWERHDEIVMALTNEKEMILTYFDKIFSERKRSLEEFYQLLHSAAAEDNSEKLQLAISGILGIIKESPLKDLADFRAAWSNPDFTFEF